MHFLIVDALVLAGIFGLIVAYQLKKRTKNFDRSSHDIGMIYAASLAFLGFGTISIMTWFFK